MYDKGGCLLSSGTTTCSLREVQAFCCFFRQGITQSLRMEAASSFKQSIDFQQTTQCYKNFHIAYYCAVPNNTD